MIKKIVDEIIDNKKLIPLKFICGGLTVLIIFGWIWKENWKELTKVNSMANPKDIATIARNIDFIIPSIYAFVIKNPNLVAGYAFISVTACVSSEFLKYFFPEERPDKSKKNSFPSGHAVLAFLVAHFVYFRLNKSLGIFFYIVGFAICWTRVYYKKHFLHDVIAGGLLSVILVQYLQASCYLIIKKLFLKNK